MLATWITTLLHDRGSAFRGADAISDGALMAVPIFVQLGYFVRGGTLKWSGPCSRKQGAVQSTMIMQKDPELEES